MIFREQTIIYAQAGAMPEARFRELLGKARDLDMAEVKRQEAEKRNDAQTSGSA
jgi:thioredoxin 1